MIYDFICKCKGKEPVKVQIDKPVSEYYIPLCPNCEKPMKRVYYVPNLSAGCLNKDNLPK